MISLIVAASLNDVIGVDGGLPWHLPDDLKRFKALTTGKPIVMGRRTFESIGRPLPGRRNVVLTRQGDLEIDGVDMASSVSEAIARSGRADEIMVIGGGEIYARFLPGADRVYLTRVNVEIDGDTHFPKLGERDWVLLESELHESDAQHTHAFSFLTYERRR